MPAPADHDAPSQSTPGTPAPPAGRRPEWLTFTYWLYWFVLSVARLIIVLAFHAKAGGRRPRERRGYLLICNHTSYLDPIVMSCTARPIVAFIARDSLFRHPLFGGFIRNLNALPIIRGRKDQRAFDAARAQLARGHGVMVFAEGTRSLDGQLQPFRGGIELIARQTRVPIYFGCAAGPFDALPKGRSLTNTRWRRIQIHYDGPVLPEEYLAWPKRALPERLWQRMLEVQRAARATLAHRDHRLARPTPPPGTPMRPKRDANAASRT